MAKLSKRVKAFREKVDANKSYPLSEAIALLKESATVKFNESVEVAVNLGVDARKSDQGVRGATTLPHGTGSDVRVAVFTQGENAEKAKEAGADLVGMEDLADQIKGGMMDFDVVIASPDAMRVVGQLGQVLGPRGLMPNPKTGTVTPDIVAAVENAKAGQMRFRTDKNGIIHGGIGKISFEPEAIEGNLMAVLADLKKAKPASAKGVYFRKVSLSTTMGPGITIDHSDRSLIERDSAPRTVWRRSASGIGRWELSGIGLHFEVLAECVGTTLIRTRKAVKDRRWGCPLKRGIRFNLRRW
jgi:large subunit ribosomal protein L1